MKIGILTFHRAYNYGAVLQCFALQEYLKNQGHDVAVIDYRQPWTEKLRRVISWVKIKQLSPHPKALISYLVKTLSRKKKFAKCASHFNYFISTYLDIRDTCYNKYDIPQHYDVYIIGSDQLWGLSCLGGKMDHVYMGEFFTEKKKKIIGYAISTNKYSLDLKGKEIFHKLCNFQKISLREDSSCLWFREKYNLEIPSCIDPTLLSDEEVWNPLLNTNWEKKKYVLIYEARDSVKYPKLLINKAREVVDILGGDFDIVNLSEMSYSVKDFVSAFKYAQYIVTTSFHATVFSLIFKRPFYAIKLHDKADGRYVNLLKTVGLEKFCVEPDFTPILSDYDFVNAEKLLDNYRRSSKMFLSDF